MVWSNNKKYDQSLFPFLSKSYYFQTAFDGSGMMAQASVLLRFKSKEQLESVFKAVKPETRTALTKRSKVQVSMKDDLLVLDFEAADTSALRAAMNSFLHWILLTKDVLESLEPNKV